MVALDNIAALLVGEGNIARRRTVATEFTSSINLCMTIAEGNGEVILAKGLIPVSPPLTIPSSRKASSPLARASSSRRVPRVLSTKVKMFSVFVPSLRQRFFMPSSSAPLTKPVLKQLRSSEAEPNQPQKAALSRAPITSPML